MCVRIRIGTCFGVTNHMCKCATPEGQAERACHSYHRSEYFPHLNPTRQGEVLERVYNPGCMTTQLEGDEVTLALLAGGLTPFEKVMYSGFR